MCFSLINIVDRYIFSNQLLFAWKDDVFNIVALQGVNEKTPGGAVAWTHAPCWTRKFSFFSTFSNIMHIFWHHVLIKLFWMNAGSMLNQFWMSLELYLYEFEEWNHGKMSDNRDPVQGIQVKWAPSLVPNDLHGDVVLYDWLLIRLVTYFYHPNL